MFEIGITTQFEAAHHLVGEFGPASRVHGHTYRVEVAARGPSLADDGTLFDISILQQAVAEVLAQLHYHDLAELELFKGRNTTAEMVALTLHEQVAARVQAPALSTMV